MFSSFFVSGTDYSARNDGNIPEDLKNISEYDGENWVGTFFNQINRWGLYLIIATALSIAVRLVVKYIRGRKNSRSTPDDLYRDLSPKTPSRAESWEKQQQTPVDQRPEHHMVTDEEYRKNRGYDLN